jgi:hypothetical protein
MKTTEICAANAFMNRSNFRQVLDCASPLALFHRRRPNRKRQRTAALQDAGASESLYAIRQSSTLAVAFLLFALIAASLLLLCPPSAHAQGGVPLWTNRFEAGPSGGSYGIVVDNAGNVFVTGYSNDRGNEDYVTIKYSNAGLPLWTNWYSGPGNSGRAAAIAVDGSGNVFVTGESAATTDQFCWPSCFDYATIAYSSAGVPLWTNRYDGPENNYDSATAIAVDSSGNVFVTGYSRSGSDSLSDDYATIAYSSAGVPLWTNRYDGANGLDRAAGIVVDTSGNVFVTGISSEEATFDGNFEDFATVAYSNAGVPLWTNRYDGPAQRSDEAGAIAVDISGNVFVTGRSFADFSNPINQDYATVAYSNSGEPLWTNRYDRSGGYETPKAIAVDSSGNVFVTGGSAGANDFYWATVAYSSAGVKLWTRLYKPPLGGGGEAIAVDRSGNVFVTGESGSGGATVAYSNSGVPLWTNRVANVYLSKMAVDRNGNVFVTGYSQNGTNYDFVTIKYSSSIPLPRVDFQKLNNQLVLSWTNAAFNLQSAPALTATFTNIPAATSPYTNSLTGPQQFFRLRSD